MRLLATALLLLGARVAAEPVLVLEADRGTFEEALALDGAGGRLALVRVDAAGRHTLELVDVDQKGAVLGRFGLGPTPPSSLTLHPAGIFVVTPSPDGESETAALHARTGKILRRFGPAGDLVLAGDVVGGLTARDKTLEVVLHEVSGARAPVRRVFTRAGSVITKLELEAAVWRGGYALLAGRRQGRYDAASDLALPDTDAVYDVARDRWVRDRPIADPLLHARVLRERARRPNVESLVTVEGGRLYAITPEDRVVELDVSLEVYEPASLRQQTFPDGRVVFSLTVDPLNPAALARQKRDPERIDVFRFDASSEEPGRPVRLLTLDRDGRDFVWAASATRLALLRKHRA